MEKKLIEDEEVARKKALDKARAKEKAAAKKAKAKAEKERKEREAKGTVVSLDEGNLQGTNKS